MERKKQPRVSEGPQNCSSIYSLLNTDADGQRAREEDARDPRPIQLDDEDENTMADDKHEEEHDEEDDEEGDEEDDEEDDDGEHPEMHTEVSTLDTNTSDSIVGVGGHQRYLEHLETEMYLLARYPMWCDRPVSPIIPNLGIEPSISECARAYRHTPCRNRRGPPRNTRPRPVRQIRPRPAGQHQLLMEPAPLGMMPQVRASAPTATPAPQPGPSPLGRPGPLQGQTHTRRPSPPPVLEPMGRPGPLQPQAHTRRPSPPRVLEPMGRPGPLHRPAHDGRSSPPPVLAPMRRPGPLHGPSPMGRPGPLQGTAHAGRPSPPPVLPPIGRPGPLQQPANTGRPGPLQQQANIARPEPFRAFQAPEPIGPFRAPAQTGRPTPQQVPGPDRRDTTSHPPQSPTLPSPPLSEGFSISLDELANNGAADEETAEDSGEPRLVVEFEIFIDVHAGSSSASEGRSRGATAFPWLRRSQGVPIGSPSEDEKCPGEFLVGIDQDQVRQVLRRFGLNGDVATCRATGRIDSPPGLRSGNRCPVEYHPTMSSYLQQRILTQIENGLRNAGPRLPFMDPRFQISPQPVVQDVAGQTSNAAPQAIPGPVVEME